MAVPALEPSDIAGETITADALAAQRKPAEYGIDWGARYLCVAQDDQSTLAADTRLHFPERPEPDLSEPSCPQHKHIESRAIWIASALNV
jgi:predicted transposase YbfD/YdcC